MKTTAFPRPQIYVYAVALISIGALAWTARGLPLLAFFAVAILASNVIEARLVDRTFLRMLIRILIIGLIYAVTPDDPSNTFDQFGPARTRNMFGEICAAEMVIQFWRYRSYDPERSTLIILLMSGFTFLTASNTFEETYIRYITPAYLIGIAMMARSYRPRRAPSALRRENGIANALRIIALAAVLIVGAFGYKVVVSERGALTDLGNKLVFKESWNGDTGGMSAQPALGSTFGLRGTNERVLKIDNFDQNPYYRGVAYDKYDQGRWGPAVAERHWETVAPASLHVSLKKALTKTTVMRVSRLANDNPLIYLPLATGAIDPGDATGISVGFETRSPIRIRAKAPYEYLLTTSGKSNFQGVSAPALSDNDRATCLLRPDVEPEMAQVQQLAARLAGNLKDPNARIMAIQDYLLTHYPYSLSFQSNGKGDDPIVDFLFSKPVKGAHCEYFATSAALMLRYVGIPTRYVTGYYAHEFGEQGAIVVRQRDAHAWCEAWVDGVGWETVEATPESGRPDALSEKEPVEMWRRALEWVQDTLQAFSDFLANITSVQIGIGVGIIAVGTGAGFLVRRYVLLRKTGPPSAGPRQYTPASDLELGRLSRRFEAVWEAKYNSPFPENRSYGDYLRVVHRASPENPDTFIDRAAAFALLYEGARFGGRNDPQNRVELEKIIKDMEASHD